MHSGMQSTPVNHVAKTGHPPELLDKKKLVEVDCRVGKYQTSIT